ncbi:MAG: DNA-deoxyinosine glycosylase [Lachnospiraceae bacterium]|nr:DNA-deoxyinosine glycosylase [Lachnospiraceae bacterium]
MQYTHVVHPFEPVYDQNSKILILGSFPSVKSREQKFFYGHPRNRFWKVLAGVLDREVPGTICEKKAFLLENHIAVWDVIASCEIKGSSDSSIKNAQPTDLAKIIAESKVERIFVNGQTAGRMYAKYQEKMLGMKARVLPSTSPANAAFSTEKLIQIWQEALLDI